MRNTFSFTDHLAQEGSEWVALDQWHFRTPKVSDMNALSPKELCLAFLTQKRSRMIRLTRSIFGDFWNSAPYTDEVESGIQ